MFTDLESWWWKSSQEQIPTFEVFTDQEDQYRQNAIPDGFTCVVNANLLKESEEYFLEKLNCISSIMKVALMIWGASKTKKQHTRCSSCAGKKKNQTSVHSLVFRDVLTLPVLSEIYGIPRSPSLSVII